VGSANRLKLGWLAPAWSLSGALEPVGVVDDDVEGGAGGESDCCLGSAVPSADDISTSIASAWSSASKFGPVSSLTWPKFLRTAYLGPSCACLQSSVCFLSIGPKHANFYSYEPLRRNKSRSTKNQASCGGFVERCRLFQITESLCRKRGTLDVRLGTKWMMGIYGSFRVLPPPPPPRGGGGHFLKQHSKMADLVCIVPCRST